MMKTCVLKILGCFIVLQQGCGQNLGKSQASSYFFMKQNGGYEYAFNTDTGMQSAQTADQSNEVTGHYMYYEKGVPFMVKYRAGVNGYQPEIIPIDKLMGGSFNDRKLPNYASSDNSLTARELRSTSLQETHTNNYRLTAPKVSAFNIDTDTTLNFVQNALKTMQSQPMHMSFNTDSRQVQHNAGGHYTTTMRPIVSTILQPVSRTEVQEINNLSLLPSAALADTKHSYSFNYNNADQSARSETSDPAGNVVGSYSYFDEPGYHDIEYKANDNSGFMVLGGNLAPNQPSSSSSATSSLSSVSSHQTQRRQLYRSNNFNFNNYRITPDTRLTANALDERNLGKRSLRKFRRYAKW